MKLTGLHLLLTYQCNYECDHCFVWGGPQHSGTMRLETIRRILEQADDLQTIEWVYFEGGEPFLFYPILLAGVRLAADCGYRVGIVTNGYWATGNEDAHEWLRPFAGLLGDLSVSSDDYHGDERIAVTARAACARRAAERLEIPAGVITIGQPEASETTPVSGQLPEGESGVMYRGRAAEKLVPRARPQPWERFAECPWENLRDPGRVHIDPFGNVHVCQGLSIGNLNRRALSEMCRTYDPDAHPVIGALLEGGPAGLARRYGLRHRESYADACHLCYESRLALRTCFPDTLAPDSMYGLVE